MHALFSYTLLTSARDRMLPAFLGLLFLIAAAVHVLSGTALVEQQQTGTTLFAGAARLLLVFGGGAFVLLQIQRGWQEGAFTFFLSKPLSRASVIVGLAGSLAFTLTLLWLAVCLVGMFFLPLNAQSLRWMTLLLLESQLMGAVAFCIAIRLRRTFPALLAFTGFYLLFRLMPEFLIAAQSPLSQGESLDAFLAGITRALGLLTPRLDLFASSQWLELTAPTPDLLFPFIQTVLYVAFFLLLSFEELRRYRLSRA